MSPRQNKGLRPQIVFTSDFHELVRGDLIPGACKILYDPLRLVEGRSYDNPPDIRVSVRFHPVGGSWDGTLVIPSRVNLGLLADPCGEGVMCEGWFNIPPGCEELEIWFSTCRDGRTFWDTEFGKNYWMRFTLHDLDIKKAKRRAFRGKGSSQDALDCLVESVPGVQRMTLRLTLTNPTGHPRTETEMAVVPKEGAAKLWSTPVSGIPIPKGATAAFDLVYYVEGRKQTDDNQGRWYVAD
jgi:hypothetical protein